MKFKHLKIAALLLIIASGLIFSYVNSAKAKSAPKPNTSISVLVDNKKYSGTAVFQCTSCKPVRTIKISYKNGTINTVLTNGTYVINKISSNGGNYEMAAGFSVSGGKMKPLAVKLKEHNFKGIIKGLDSGKILINDAADQEKTRYTIKVFEGSFSASLPDGSYIINYENKSGGENSAFKKFDIKKGQLNRAINLTASPFNAEVTIKEEGDPISSGFLFLENDDFLFKFPYANGKMSLSLPEGTYYIKGFWDSLGRFYNHEKKITVSKNQASPAKIDLSTPAFNIKGTFFKADLPLEQGYLYLHPSDSSSYSTVRIDKGVFKESLRDGEYTIKSYIDLVKGNHIPLAYPIKVLIKGGKSVPLSINVPGESIEGNVSINGKTLEKGYLYLHNVYTGGPAYSFHVKKGRFTASLPDGIYGTVLLKGQYHQLIKIQNGVADGPININVRENNVIGSVTNNGELMKNIRFDIFNKETERKWPIPITTATGKFNVTLADGNYYIENIYDGKQFIKLDGPFEFSIVNGLLNSSALNIELQTD